MTVRPSGYAGPHSEQKSRWTRCLRGHFASPITHRESQMNTVVHHTRFVAATGDPPTPQGSQCPDEPDPCVP